MMNLLIPSTRSELFPARGRERTLLRLGTVAVIIRSRSTGSPLNFCNRNLQECSRRKPSCSGTDGKPGRKCGCKKILSAYFTFRLAKTAEKSLWNNSLKLTSCLFNYLNSCNILMSAPKREEIELWTDIPFCQESRSRMNLSTSFGML